MSTKFYPLTMQAKVHIVISFTYIISFVILNLHSTLQQLLMLCLPAFMAPFQVLTS